MSRKLFIIIITMIVHPYTSPSLCHSDVFDTRYEVLFFSLFSLLLTLWIFMEEHRYGSHFNCRGVDTTVTPSTTTTTSYSESPIVVLTLCRRNILLHRKEKGMTDTNGSLSLQDLRSCLFYVSAYSHCISLYVHIHARY